MESGGGGLKDEENLWASICEGRPLIERFKGTVSLVRFLSIIFNVSL